MVNSMTQSIKTAWRSAVQWFEHGDLIPLMVIVSAVHYAGVLRGKDDIISAIAIGLLVDLGHYRTVRYAVRYNGDRRWEITIRWVVAAIMTVVSFEYHHRYYNDLLLAAPLPFLIAVLAWLESRNQRKSETPANALRMQPTACERITNASETLAQNENALRTQAVATETQRETFTAHCDCGWSHNHYPSARSARNAEIAHSKKHKVAAV